MSATPTATTPTNSPKAPSSPKAPRKPLGCGKRAAEEAENESPAKKYCVGEKTYPSIEAWVVAEGFKPPYDDVQSRYNEKFGVQTFADLYEDSDTKCDITSWEAYDKWVREYGEDETDTLIDVMHEMVTQVRDQNALIQELYKKLEARS